ncbi:hypothetical protein Y1Q_0019844 [Alligator mississippiensis]|uniref:Uncharacterized protein n=1 Tax=Alligator mississippiensis TaxID=8496 RepID=A0A151PFJ8_ALLMI|nr:hypothetical protein Y1Q_0019844 [Alligator mississippiensis]
MTAESASHRQSSRKQNVCCLHDNDLSRIQKAWGSTPVERVRSRQASWCCCENLGSATIFRSQKDCPNISMVSLGIMEVTERSSTEIYKASSEDGSGHKNA